MLGYLEEVIDLSRAVPFKTFNTDVGHKKGMAAGRYPQKAAKEFLRMVKSVESNAQSKGLNTSNLKIITLLSNKASIPATGGRHRRGTKRTHLEIEVKEVVSKKSSKTPTKSKSKALPTEKKQESSKVKVEKETKEVKEELKPESKIEDKPVEKEMVEKETIKKKEAPKVEQKEEIQVAQPEKSEEKKEVSQEDTGEKQ